MWSRQFGAKSNKMKIHFIYHQYVDNIKEGILGSEHK